MTDTTTYSNCKKYLSLTTQKWPWNDDGYALRKEARAMTLKYHPDKCTTDTCKLKYPLAIELLDFFKESNANACHKIIGDQIGAFVDTLAPFAPPWDVSNLDYVDQKVLVGVAETHGWHL